MGFWELWDSCGAHFLPESGAVLEDLNVSTANASILRNLCHIVDVEMDTSFHMVATRRLRHFR